MSVKQAKRYAVPPVNYNGPQPKRFYIRSKAITTAAEGKPCTLRIVNVCNNDWSTTVGAHSNLFLHGKHKNLKADDNTICFACSSCHNWLDFNKDQSKHLKTYFQLLAAQETMRTLILEGVVNIVDVEVPSQ